MPKPIKGRAGAPCRTCQHPQRKEIDARLARIAETAESIRGIAAAYGLHPDSLARHHKTHLPKALAVVAERHAELEQETKSMDVLASLGRAASKAEAMLDACDTWLRDPEDLSRYTLTPRSTEVEVVWQDGPKRRKTKLGELLDRVEKVSLEYVAKELVGRVLVDVERGAVSVEEACRELNLAQHAPDLPPRLAIELVEAKVADPRKLLLDAVATLKPVVELLGKASGALKTDGPAVMVNLMQHPDMQRIAGLHDALMREYPEAGAWLAQQMREGAAVVDVKAIGGRR